MSLVMRSLTIVVMLIHSVCGCCWHHDHASCSADEPGHRSHEAVAQKETAHAGCAHGHAHHHHGHAHHGETPAPADETSSPSEEPDGPVAPCQEETCVYVASKAPVLSQPILFVADLPVGEDLIAAAALARGTLRADEPRPRSLSALEACALLQVWRI